MFELKWLLFGWVTVLIAALIQGMTGFGFALVAVPLLSSFLLPKEVVPIIITYCLVLNFMMLFKQRKFIKIAPIKGIIIFGIIGIPIGVYLLNVLTASQIKLFASVLIIFSSLMMIFGWEWKTHKDFLATCVAGLISGILNGSTSMSGPPIVLFLANKKVGKESFRSYLPTYGLITNFLTLIVLFFNHNFNKEVLIHMLSLCPALIIGLFTGIVLVKRINEAVFRKLSLYLILGTGCYTFVTVLLSSKP